MEILKPGWATSIQELGRTGFAQYGVPRSGAMDQKAFCYANILLGNTINLPVLEWTIIPPQLLFTESTTIVCTGATATPIINGIPQKMNCQLVISKGEILSFDFVGKGVYGYIAIQGGFKTKKVLNSSSMFFPVTTNGVLGKNNSLVYETSELTLAQNSKIKYDDSYLNNTVLQVFPGPEFDLLSKELKNNLFHNQFTISRIRNRMGIQLVELLTPNNFQILTGPVLPGTVQLTPSGKLIILMRDCQTTGGYPRIFQLHESSIDVVAQKETRKLINFSLIE